MPVGRSLAAMLAPLLLSALLGASAVGASKAKMRVARPGLVDLRFWGSRGLEVNTLLHARQISGAATSELSELANYEPGQVRSLWAFTLILSLQVALQVQVKVQLGPVDL